MQQQQPEFVRSLFSSIAGRYDLANHLLSGGMDFLWRAEVSQIVKRWHARKVLDLATGSGDLAIAIQRTIPEAKIIGADFCLPMLKKAQEKKFPALVQADGMRLPFRDATFDAVTVAFGLRNMESWPAALREIQRVITPGGHLLVLDFSLPNSALLRQPYRWYLHRVLPIFAGWLTGDKKAYDYLGDSIEKFPSGKAMEALLKECGYHSPQSKCRTGGIVTIYTTQKPAN